MALQNELVTDKEWEEFLVKELSVPIEKARTYASSFVDEGYSKDSITHLLAHSLPGQPPQLLLDLGLKVGHCLKLASYFSSPPAVAVAVAPNQSNKMNIPRPVISLNINQTTKQILINSVTSGRPTASIVNSVQITLGHISFTAAQKTSASK